MIRSFYLLIFAVFCVVAIQSPALAQEGEDLPLAVPQQTQPDELPFTEMTEEQQGDILYREYVDTRIQKLYALFKRIAIADTYLHVCDPGRKVYKRAPYRMKAGMVARHFKQDVKRFRMIRYNTYTDILLDAVHALIAVEAQQYMKDTNCEGSRAKEASDFIKNLSGLTIFQFDYYLRYIEVH